MFTPTVSGDEIRTHFKVGREMCRKNIINPIFIIDNVRIHYYAKVKELINEKSLNVLYLSPYCPMLNPIKTCFSKWKNYCLRGQQRTEERLNELIRTGFQAITPDDCNAFFRKMLVYLLKAEQEEMFFE